MTASTALGTMASRLALIALLATTAACAGQHTTRTGFLGPAGRQTADTSEDFSFVAPAQRWVGYTAVIIDRPTFVPGGEVPVPPSAEDVAALTRHYGQALEDAFGARFRRTLTAGPGVLRVRAAVTGYTLADIVTNIIATPLIGPVSNGGAASEAEVVDSVTGERLAALATHTNGFLLREGPIPFYVRRGHAEWALTDHARRLVESLPTAQVTR
ncbi:MAG: DUF3313 family protein [Alphaproteobacteria bacterium]|nr:DUF3313 family protein [Alphaproteobacteria bacterium]